MMAASINIIKQQAAWRQGIICACERSGIKLRPAAARPHLQLLLCCTHASPARPAPPRPAPSGTRARKHHTMLAPRATPAPAPAGRGPQAAPPTPCRHAPRAAARSRPPQCPRRARRRCARVASSARAAGGRRARAPAPQTGLTRRQTTCSAAPTCSTVAPMYTRTCARARWRPPLRQAPASRLLHTHARARAPPPPPPRPAPTRDGATRSPSRPTHLSARK